MSNLIEYGDFSIESIKQQKQKLDASTNTKFIKLTVGKNVLRFIPPKKGQKPFTIVHQHFIRIPGKQGPVVFACPAKHGGAFCPACTQANSLAASGNREDKNKAYELWPSLRVYANVINRAAPEAGPGVLAFGKQIYDQLVGILTDEDAGGNFFDPTEDGFDIIIQREGTGKSDTRYKVLPARRTSPLGTIDESNNWISTQRELTHYANPPEEHRLNEMLGVGDFTPQRQLREPTAGSDITSIMDADVLE